MIVGSTPSDVWITFHGSRLWWCRLAESMIEQDEVSKYRILKGVWSDTDIKGNLLLIEQLPGRLAQIQGFRGTACRVREVEELRRLLNHQPSEVLKAIQSSREDLAQKVVEGIRQLHWKDFEVLVDLVFRASGGEGRSVAKP